MGSEIESIKNIYFEKDGKIIPLKMGIDEFQLTCDINDELKKEDMFFNNIPTVSFTFNLDKKANKKFRKTLIPSKGYRNAMILRQDGYLSPQNCDKE